MQRLSLFLGPRVFRETRGEKRRKKIFLVGGLQSSEPWNNSKDDSFFFLPMLPSGNGNSPTLSHTYAPLTPTFLPTFIHTTTHCGCVEQLGPHTLSYQLRTRAHTAMCLHHEEASHWLPSIVSLTWITRHPESKVAPIQFNAVAHPAQTTKRFRTSALMGP